MNIKAKTVHFTDGKKGTFAVSPEYISEKKLIRWVLDKEFYKYVGDKYKMNLHTRKRNKLYSFKHPLLDKEVILKVSNINNQYSFQRRLNLLLSTFFSDYNFRAFKGAILLKDIGVDCANPILYWTESGFLYKKISYYMYEKIHADHSLFSFSENLSNNNSHSNAVYKKLAEKTVNIIKQIHNAGFRQGDPHPGNFLISSPTENFDSVGVEEINNIKMYIIDLDKFSVSKPVGKKLKRFFDLRCMRRCTLGTFDQIDMLKIYLQDEYSYCWKFILRFWMRGGFNPVKWFKKPKKGR